MRSLALTGMMLLALAASATTVSAHETAWVLWGLVERTYSTSPNVEPALHPWSAYENRAECIAGLYRTGFKEYRLSVSERDGRAYIYDDKKKSNVQFAVCLPEGVKP